MDILIPETPLPTNIKAFFTTRTGGVSLPPYQTLNLSYRVGDSDDAVSENRQRLLSHLPDEPMWIKQAHGKHALHADAVIRDSTIADATFTSTPNVVCVVQTADCLPILLYDTSGTAVAAVHAGWRGIAANIINHTIAAMQQQGRLVAIIGPCISGEKYIVGEDAKNALCQQHNDNKAFKKTTTLGKWRTDLSLIAVNRLHAAGVSDVFICGQCTYANKTRFFSARRDTTQTGRQAGIIYIN